MNPSFSSSVSSPSRSLRSARGSALVLAVAIVVLLALMGAAYLQVARTDRRTSVEVDTRANVDTSSILAFLGQILAEDVPTAPGSVAPEPYDFPWTNDAPAAPGEELIVPDVFAPVTVPGPEPDFTSVNNNQPARPPRATGNLPDPAGRLFAESGGGDDLWLASNEPDFGSNTWPHLSNVLGLFLDLRPGSLVAGPDGNGMFPQQYLSTADSNALSGNVNLPFGAMQTDFLNQAAPGNMNRGSLFADASGDGIADSRWTWAPVPSDAGLAFVMAVRIIDNSAKVNLNAWTNPATGLTVDSARWNWPGELQLERALAAVRGNAGVGTLNAQDVMEGVNLRAMSGTTGPERYENWLTTTSTLGGRAGNLDDFEEIGPFLDRDDPMGNAEDFGALTREDRVLGARSEETELRWKEGLNRSDDNLTVAGATQLEQEDQPLFRSNDLETDFATTGFTTPQSFYQDEPRKQLTTLSGSTNAGRINLNSGSAGALANVFSAPLSFNGGTLRVPALFDALGWTDYFTAGPAVDQFEDAANAFGNQLGAVAKDFQDSDSEFTIQGNAYGMERVPVISEIYAHARYIASNVTAVAGPPMTETADLAFADVGVVVELVNPWAVETSITNIELVIDGESWGELDQLLNKDTMEGHEIAVIRRPDADAAAVGPSQGPIPNPGVETDEAKMADADDYPVDATALTLGIDVELIARDSEGDDVEYQTVEVFAFPNAATGVTFAPGVVGNGDSVYTFTRVVGTANGLNALAARSVDFLREVNGVSPPAAPFFVPAAELPATQFGDASKGVMSTATGISGALSDLDNRILDAADLDATADPGDEPWTIGDVGRLTRTGDILQMVFMGPRPVEVGGLIEVEGIAESWIRSTLENGNTTNALLISDLMMDIGETDTTRFVDNNATGPSSLNFAAVWMNRFAVDRQIGSGLIPGRINVNTVPQRILEAALPIDDANARQDIAAAIVAARENPSSQAAPDAVTLRTGRVGLSALGELAGNEAIFLNSVNNDADLVDFNESELGLNFDASPAADGHTGDREERNRLISYLHQVASTRSDIFTAYVLVRAYPVTDFSAPPVDEFRLLAVFDRSSVSGGNSQPRIIAAERLDDN